MVSFRKLTPFSNETVEEPDPDISFDTNIPEESPVLEEPVTRINLIAGDSFSAALDADKLGRSGRKKVINISEGGATIDGVLNQLNGFYTANTNVLVDKILISVGTNDIRHCRERGVGHLRSPLVHLAKHVKLLFPDASVWFQCIPPLPLQHKYSIRNVEGYNRLLFHACAYTGTYILSDIFDKFLYLNYASGNLYRRESYFKSPSNIHPNKVGLSVLAKSYIRIIHSNRHNPLGY